MEADLLGKRPEPEGGLTVNQDYLRALSEMGIPEPMAEKALLMTGGHSVEAAATWYFDCPDDLMDEPKVADQEELLRLAGEVETNWTGKKLPTCTHMVGGLSGQLKMIFVVNEELKMGKGKIAAQVAHACLGLYRTLQQHEASYGQHMVQWEKQGETSIVLSGSNTEHLLDLQRRASFASLPTHLTQDVGKTEVPSGACTVLSIFGDAKLLDQITGTLSLL
ncbi:probable peptidyl-tRNA hydrolase 2 [Acanthaster planci]|uniref:peptidyl-tRNA hydrolase n=1 Tax=Acanthaster planci TaxID=133434 RepID=A0A8B7YQU5_ACAPL|nr:probable peptidyl-tRNA hydrolase 2 [Acanthaster planci]XP_022095047.1 probable peptidyl-tRNA hydrolase 2 [Acanthaster planci]XP_022095056.1 probable peptidyl-tRNA hydrolase 2 [Acanthaster planci]XP_022095066.1 probable peptidyl-tRNA hydrolase 2 [Acanthaster planci]XP_022095075.1 probable peptidyl-tRNA hydrolase 2 [Acanthaster planci]XP_022095083.1 probable peptidyl-tRNA hydrolase 2 [Acanthaster planci]XP_022095092.1 probable peptidyl-tRNA hydrolase 2 [Acanthaster planci]XP_022095097.1 pro